MSSGAMAELAELADSRSVPWAVATRTPSSEEEVLALSLGAVEYLPLKEGEKVANIRLSRILRDRHNLDREQKKNKMELNYIRVQSITLTRYSQPLDLIYI